MEGTSAIPADCTAAEGITFLSVKPLVAERHLVSWDSEGREREIVVKLDAPLQIETVTGPVPLSRANLCLGVDHIVYDPGGEDAFIALCHALDLIGQVLEGESKSLSLQNRYKTGEPRSPAWVWQYMDEPNRQT